jgi:hypothetical protein
MIIIGDSLIQNLPDIYNVISFPGMSLETYVTFHNYDHNEDTIIYCFGINDLNNGILYNDVINNYNKLKKGKINTCIILPPFQELSFYELCEENVSNSINFIETFVELYEAYDGLHPTNKTIDRLILDIITKI